MKKLSEMSPEELQRKLGADAHRYEMIKSPLFVWQSWLSARACETEIPDWVLEYLDECAKEVIKCPAPL